jgi:hypothetical protein
MKKYLSITTILIFACLLSNAQQRFEINATDTITAKVDYIIFRFDGDFSMPLRSKDTANRNNRNMDENYYERMNAEKSDSLTKLVKVFINKLTAIPGVAKYEANLSDLTSYNRYNYTTALFYYKVSGLAALNDFAELTRSPEFKYVRKTIIQVKLQNEADMTNELRYRAVQKATSAAKDMAKRLNSNKVQLLSVIEERPYEVVGYLVNFNNSMMVLNEGRIDQPGFKNEFYLRNTYKVAFNISNK